LCCEVTGDDLPNPAYAQARRPDRAEVMVRDLLALHVAMNVDRTGEIEIAPVLAAPLDD
jgi:hypothetical protein